MALSFGDKIYEEGDLSTYVIDIEDIHNSKMFKRWQGQRYLDANRAKQIAKFYESNYKKYENIRQRSNILVCYLAVDTFYDATDLSHDDSEDSEIALIKDEMYETGEYKIIDGQHRLCALKHLFKKGIIPGNVKVRVDIIRTNSMEEVKQEFHFINMSVPVAMHVIEPCETANVVATRLWKEYPKAFSRSMSPHTPTMSIDKFIDCIIRCIIKKKRYSPDELYDRLIALNKELSLYKKKVLLDIISKRNMATRDSAVKGLKRIKENPGKFLHIGLFRKNGWIEYLE